MAVSVLPEEERPTETEEDDDGIIKLLHFDVILSLQISVIMCSRQLTNGRR